MAKYDYSQTTSIGFQLQVCMGLMIMMLINVLDPVRAQSAAAAPPPPKISLGEAIAGSLTCENLGKRFTPCLDYVLNTTTTTNTTTKNVIKVATPTRDDDCCKAVQSIHILAFMNNKAVKKDRNCFGGVTDLWGVFRIFATENATKLITGIEGMNLTSEAADEIQNRMGSVVAKCDVMKLRVLEPPLCSTWRPKFIRCPADTPAANRAIFIPLP